MQKVYLVKIITTYPEEAEFNDLCGIFSSEERAQNYIIRKCKDVPSSEIEEAYASHVKKVFEDNLRHLIAVEENLKNAKKDKERWAKKGQPDWGSSLLPMLEMQLQQAQKDKDRVISFEDYKRIFYSTPFVGDFLIIPVEMDVEINHS